jgi:group II intron reverse transcriptase/maturase
MRIGEMQRVLSQKAERESAYQFKNLYYLMYNSDWLRAAHDRVKQNAGSQTAGIDGKTMRSFDENLEGNLEALRQELRAKEFEPAPVRRVYIPKSNGKRRPLGIATVNDRIVQEALRMILEPIWEADFSRHSYGFRPNRSTKDAIAYIGVRLTGPAGRTYQWVIEGDLQSYFDEIPHRKLMKRVKRRIGDGDICQLIWQFLRAGVLEQGTYRNTLTGAPQGGICSPLFSNLYLHDLDIYMEQYVEISRVEKNKRRRHALPNFIYVRYADDFAVLCNGTKEQAVAMKGELHDFLKSKLHLQLSLEKTKVTHITEGFTFLGYRVVRKTGISGKLAPKILIPKEAEKRVRHKIRALLAPHTHGESANAKISALNRIMRGWCEYYRTVSSPTRSFRRLQHEVYWSMVHWLGRKYKTSTPKVLRKFGKEGFLGTKTQTLLKPSDIKRKRHIMSQATNPYTSPNQRLVREKLPNLDGAWSGQEARTGSWDLRDIVLERDNHTCQRCGTSLPSWEAQVDHIKPRSRFKHRVNADTQENLQTLCYPCHKQKTQTDRRVLSRVP